MSWAGEALILLALAALTGCQVGPEYEPPDPELPATWRFGPEKASAESIADTPWWELFEDPQLQALIREALGNNLDLQRALASIARARGLLRATSALGKPRVGLDIAADVETDEDNGGNWDPPDENYQAHLLVTWEVDMWGEFARAREAAQADLESVEEYRNGVVLALVAEVARSYFALRDFDDRVTITRGTISSRERALRLAELRFEGGIGTKLAVSQAEVELAQVRTLLPLLERDVALGENAIATLLGRPPGDVERGWSNPDQSVPPELPPGLTGDMLARRPDIRQAERRLVSANARVGVALAQFYPRLSLSAHGGLETDLRPERIFQSDALIWGAVGKLFAPLFTAGALEGNLDATRAEYEIALNDFRFLVLGALREVSDALISFRQVTEARRQQEKLVTAAQEYLRLARLQFDNGIVGYIDVLDAQRSLFEARLRLSQHVRDQLFAVVQLYKALGGGWRVEPPSAPVPRVL